MLRRSGRPPAAAEVKYSFGAAPRGHSASLLYFSPRSHAIITDLSVVPAISLHPASNNPPAGSRTCRKHPPPFCLPFRSTLSPKFYVLISVRALSPAGSAHVAAGAGCRPLSPGGEERPHGGGGSLLPATTNLGATSC